MNATLNNRISPPLILVVEDDESDRELAERALNKIKLPCRVEFAIDGQQAVEFFLDPESDLPSLILLDLKMPRLNGHEVLKRVRSSQRTRNCPVVVFTSSGLPADILGCFESGANSFVRKSTGVEEYIARLQEIASYWLTLNEPCPPAGTSSGL